MTSTSTVGLPRESRISRAPTNSILATSAAFRVVRPGSSSDPGARRLAGSRLAAERSPGHRGARGRTAQRRRRWPRRGGDVDPDDARPGHGHRRAGRGRRAGGDRGDRDPDAEGDDAQHEPLALRGALELRSCVGGARRCAAARRCGRPPAPRPGRRDRRRCAPRTPRPARAGPARRRRRRCGCRRRGRRPARRLGPTGLLGPVRGLPAGGLRPVGRGRTCQQPSARRAPADGLGPPARGAPGRGPRRAPPAPGRRRGVRPGDQGEHRGPTSSAVTGSSGSSTRHLPRPGPGDDLVPPGPAPTAARGSPPAPRSGPSRRPCAAPRSGAGRPAPRRGPAVGRRRRAGAG